MPTDIELYLERHTTYADLSNGEAARIIAEAHGLANASIRGRLSRASRDPKAARALSRVLISQPTTIPRSVLRQKDVIDSSKALFEEANWDENRLGLFVSDLHMPLHRLDAYELVLTIAHELNPNVITALNDALDNKGFGRHDDSSDPIYTQLWRHDFENALALQRQYHLDLTGALAQGGQLLGLMGNHDMWVFSNWRAHTKQTAETRIAEYMERLFYEEGVLLFSRGIHEGHIRLSSGLVWKHGLSTSSIPTTIARNAIRYFMDNGRASSVVMGHTHRPATIDGSTVGYRGVKFVNSGHLRHDNPAWIKHKPVAWGMGIVACEYNPVEWEHELTLINFIEKEHTLEATYKGKTYSVPLDDCPPDHLS